MVLIAIARGAINSTICNVDSTELAQCLPTISGKSPPPPTKGCCKVVRRVDMKCLCNYKSVLPSFGANPKLAMALPKKCGMKKRSKC